MPFIILVIYRLNVKKNQGRLQCYHRSDVSFLTDLLRKNTMPSSYNEANKRIMKNTLALYLRLIFTMFVALFTSRILLRTLGAEDFGIYNVVGGTVTMLSFLRTSLSTTTQRFINVELAKSNNQKANQVFSNSLSLYAAIIIFVIIIAETVGLWFLQNKLVIPQERVNAAFWVYQFSILSFAVTLFVTPFNGVIRAYENFSFYAKMGIYDVITTLAVTCLIVYLSYDKLIIYAFLVMCVIILGRIIICIYCYRHYKECRIRFSFDKDVIRNLLGYNVYVLISTIILVVKNKAISFVLNIFYGPSLNAAQGIANKLNNALSTFSLNALTVTGPQVVKSYAQNDMKRLWNLITQSSRLYFYLSLILTLPFILEIDTALHLWLGIYPEYTADFARILFFIQLIWPLTIPIKQTNDAVGKLRSHTINVSCCRILTIVVAIFVGIKGMSPVYIYFTMLISDAISTVILLIIVLKFQLKMSLYNYYKDVSLPIIKTIILVVSLPVAAHYFLSTTILSSCAVGLFTFIWNVIIVFIVGLYKNEKQMIINKLPASLRNRLNVLLRLN